MLFKTEMCRDGYIVPFDRMIYEIISHCKIWQTKETNNGLTKGNINKGDASMGTKTSIAIITVMVY